MKKLFKALGTIAMLAVLLLSFASCDDLMGLLNPDDQTKATDTYKPVVYTNYGTDGTKYELTITRTGKALVSFTPAAGDSYKLDITTAAGVTQTSSGTVKGFSGDKFTLAASINVSVSFDVTVSGNSINNITGTITVEGGVTIEGPGTITPVNSFVAVTGITSVPTSGTVGTLTLTGTVAPANATNKTIAWSVKSAGSTGAAISGSVLTTTSTGTVTVTATIANGKTESTPYTQDFAITITSGSNNLAGTTWIANVQETVSGYTVKQKSTLIFTSASTWAMGSRMEITGSQVQMGTDSGTYTASDSTVVLRGSNIPSGGISGGINGDTIVFYALTDEGKDLTFTRQSSAPNASLTGTTWKAEYEDVIEEGGSSTGETWEIRGAYTYILKFSTASTFTMDMKMVRSDTGAENSGSLNGTYTVYGNDVVLDSEGTIIGAINGDTIVIYAGNGIIFTKQ